MAGKTRALKARQKAVSNIQRITKTMQMIATARFQAMQRSALAAQDYSRKLQEVVGELAAAAHGRVDHPLLNPPAEKAGRELVLVITSNRGLCGAYNGNVLRTALGYNRKVTAEGGKLDFELVGKKGQAFFRFNDIPLQQYLSQFSDRPDFPEVNTLADRYMDAFISGKYDAVKVVYMHFVTMSRQTPEVLQLLPLEPPTAVEQDTRGMKAEVVYDFSPEPGELLKDLLPRTVKTTLYQAFNEALVSEQLARMVAMKSATDAAGKLKKDLGRQFNRARQTAITTELSEIIGGAAAVE